MSDTFVYMTIDSTCLFAMCLSLFFSFFAICFLCVFHPNSILSLSPSLSVPPSPPPPLHCPSFDAICDASCSGHRMASTVKLNGYNANYFAVWILCLAEDDNMSHYKVNGLIMRRLIESNIMRVYIWQHPFHTVHVYVCLKCTIGSWLVQSC